MKRFVAILSLSLAITGTIVQASAQIFPITGDTMFLKVADSFDWEIYGHRFTCWDETERINTHPEYIVRPRTISQSGADNQRMATNNLPATGMPMIGAMHGTNAIMLQLYCSGNFGGSPTTRSNFIRTNMTVEIQFPYLSYDRFNSTTNGWPYTTNNILKAVYSDSAYYFAPGTDAAELYSQGGSNAAVAAHWPFINSWANTAFIATNTYPANSNLWFPGGHPGNELQIARVIKDLIEEGEPTNVWTFVGDWNSSTPSQTNFLTVTGVSRTATSYSGTLLLQRNGMTVETPDSQHTNDVRQGFVLDPSISNRVFEVIRLTNVPPNATFVTSMDGEPVSTNTSVGTDLSINFFHVYVGPLHRQQMLVLDGCRQMRDVSTTNASTDMPFNNLLTEFGSMAATVWPTNNGVAGFINALSVQAANLETQDMIIHSNAQQVPHTFSITVITPRFAPFRMAQATTLHIGFMDGPYWPISDDWTNYYTPVVFASPDLEGFNRQCLPVPRTWEIRDGHLAVAVTSDEPGMLYRVMFQPN